MKKFMPWREYCKESGYPRRCMERLLASRMAEEFCFPTSGSGNASRIIRVDVFEKMEKAGEFAEVLEG